MAFNSFNSKIMITCFVNTNLHSKELICEEKIVNLKNKISSRGTSFINLNVRLSQKVL